MKIQDEEIKGKVISHLEKRLEFGLDPVTGKLTKKKGVTQTQVKQVIAKLSPEKEPIAPSPPPLTERFDPPVPPTPTAATVATIAHVPIESILPIANEKSELKPATCIGCMKWATCSAVPNTPDCKHQAGLVDLSTPDTRTDPVTYNPPRPIERTDKDDRANGVVRQQVSAVHIPDLKVIPMEIRRAELRIIAQMVMYGVEDTEKAAAERMMQEGRVICEDLCERALNNQVDEEDSFEEVSA